MFSNDDLFKPLPKRKPAAQHLYTTTETDQSVGFLLPRRPVFPQQGPPSGKLYRCSAQKRRHQRAVGAVLDPAVGFLFSAAGLPVPRPSKINLPFVDEPYTIPVVFQLIIHTK
jgi:hypothetical protein